MEELTLKPIGFIKSTYKKKYEAPKQPHIEDEKSATILLEANMNFETALHDLDTFTHIWLIYCFHENRHWKPKVLPPRKTRKKKGVFATRSPYRPNPIGMSVVKLKSIKGRKIEISDHDLLDGTPILDIKPYLNYSDSHPEAGLGWIETIDESRRAIIYKRDTLKKLDWLEEKGIDFKNEIEKRLSYDPYPHPYRRISNLKTHYQMRYKEWACDYHILEDSIEVFSVYSGFSEEKIKQLKDENIHNNFNSFFRINHLWKI